MALYDFIKDYMIRGTSAWEDFQEQHRENPYLSGELKIGGAQVAKQRELEENYLSLESLKKYQRPSRRDSP